MGGHVRCNGFFDATVKVLLWVGIGGGAEALKDFEGRGWGGLR